MKNRGCRTVYLSGDAADDGLALTSNYVYCSLNVTDGRVLFADIYARTLNTSYERLYGENPQVDAAALRKSASALLEKLRLVHAGNIVDVFLCPPGERADSPTLAVAHRKTTLDKGYALGGLRPKAVIVNYDLPLHDHLTAVSRAAAVYSDDFAARKGAHIALRSDRQGRLASSGDYPLAAARRKQVVVPPSESGREGPERRILLELCRIAELTVTEEALPAQSLGTLDELFVFRPEGLQSVLECSGCWFYNTVAQTLEKHLPRLTQLASKE